MKSQEYKNKKAKSAGFTIIETLVALTIFSIAITGVITVAARGGINTNIAKNRLTATYLADEGVELMRAMRDTRVLQQGTPASFTGGWLQFVTTSTADCTVAFPCDIDGANILALTPFPQFGNFRYPCSTTFTGISGSYCPLFYDPVTGFYNNLASGTPTAFSRSLVVTPIGFDEVQVTSTVVWREGQTMKSLSQTENMFDWYST
jgi:prepilin-type N-terminal cleavage/methylation domain-containing protein